MEHSERYDTDLEVFELHEQYEVFRTGGVQADYIISSKVKASRKIRIAARSVETLQSSKSIAHDISELLSTVMVVCMRISSSIVPVSERNQIYQA